MIREVPHVNQVRGEPKRKWFVDDYFDLMVWFGEDNRIVGFQLGYDKSGNFRTLTWRWKQGYLHNSVDLGEPKPSRPKGSPILLADGIFQKDDIASRFRQASGEMDSTIANFISAKLATYPKDTSVRRVPIQFERSL